MSDANAKHLKILLLQGGNSAERPISLRTAAAVSKGLQQLGLSVVTLDPSAQDFIAQIMKHKNEIIAVFNCLHGTQGEDGTIQGFLDILGLPYTHSRLFTASVGMNKHFSKIIFEKYGVKTPNFRILSRKDYFTALSQGREVMPKPYVLKPVSNGSTFGVNLFFTREHEDLFLSDTWPSWNFGDELLLEEYIPGKELTVGVYKGEPLTVIEIISNNDVDFYDFEAKYGEGQSQHIMPAESLTQEVYDLAMRWAQRNHEILGCTTISRSDFRYNPALGLDGLYCLEINTHPGLTETSLLPEMLAYKGISFNQLLLDLLYDSGPKVRNYLEKRHLNI